jgi:hypothetical protein
MDIFTCNIQDHIHQAKLNNPRSSRYCSGNQSSTTPALVSESINLNWISNTEHKQQVDNQLCLACGQPSYWKDLHDLNKTVNLILMPTHPTALQPDWGNFNLSCGHGVSYSWGRHGNINTSFTGPPALIAPALITPALIAIYVGGPLYNNPQHQ